MTASEVAGRAAARPATIETRKSWVIAFTALGIYSLSFGALLISAVALKDIAAELGGARSVPALAYSLAWFGVAVGGLPMGWLADRTGVRWTVSYGAVMVGAGLVLSAIGGRWTIFIGHGLLIGLIGNAAMNAPLYVYVSRWFDRRRGSALALLSSGPQLAGVMWPMAFERAIAAFGWRHTMLVYAAIEIAVVVPVALIMLRPAPETIVAAGLRIRGMAGTRVLGLPAWAAQATLCLAGFLCCVPMAMPQSHLVAFCSDVGIPVVRGAAMLSVLLFVGFLSRQIWGLIADRIGGLNTILAGSVCQVAAMSGFLLTQDEAGLFLVSAMFGFGFAGIIPAYVLAVRELFPANQASWRVPTVLLFSGSGMAAGGAMAGVIYDYVGFYAAAFATGIAFSLVHLVVITPLVLRQRRFRHSDYGAV
jgi:MFS family permease